jgi:hypothetical protein
MIRALVRRRSYLPSCGVWTELVLFRVPLLLLHLPFDHRLRRLLPAIQLRETILVFWSLLAVPSLTILIRNMRDRIVKEIRDLTLWVGNFTVLPGEKGVKITLKELANKVTRGRMFSAKLGSEERPGILGEGNKSSSSINGIQNSKNDPESAAQRLSSDRAAISQKHAKKRGSKWTNSRKVNVTTISS